MLASLATEVYSIERIRELLERARANLRELRLKNLRLAHGDGAAGLEKAAPFDSIIVAAAAPEMPQALLQQLARGGRMILPLRNGACGRAAAGPDRARRARLHGNGARSGALRSAPGGKGLMRSSLRRCLCILARGLRLAHAGAGGRSPAGAGGPAEAAGGASRAGAGAAPASAAARPGYYTVKRGDTLYSIALEHGADYRELAQWNKLEDPSKIRIGQELRVACARGARRGAGRQRAAAGGNRIAAAGFSRRPASRRRRRAEGGMKTSPKALRLPYSEQNLALLSKPEVRPDAKPEAKPEPGRSRQAAPPRPRSRGDRVRLARARQAARGLRRAEQQGPGHRRQAGRSGARRGDAAA